MNEDITRYTCPKSFRTFIKIHSKIIIINFYLYFIIIRNIFLPKKYNV